MKKVIKKVVTPLVAAAMTLSIGIGATACGDGHVHVFKDDVYTYDENTHWHPCLAGCSQKYAEKEHDFVNGVCSVCEYVEGTTPHPPVPPVINPGDTTDPNPPVVEPEDPTVQYTVTFETNGGSAVEPQTVNKGAMLANAKSTLSGKYLVGWFTDAACTSPWNFKSSVTKDMTLYAKWDVLNDAIKEIQAYNESLAVKFKEANPAATKVEYRSASGSVWTKVDSELIRADGSDSRVDILGLAEGSYKVRITLSSGAAIETPEIAVTAYDRSGYAHYKYTNGVGAYNDDGTLKDNAVVIYVTEQNKNTVMDEIAEKYSSVNMFQIPYYAASGGKDWGGKNASGIGWWLNNTQYSASNETSSKKGHRPSNTYDPTNGKNLGMRSVNAPVAVRFIGTVTTPEGLSEYNGWDEGGIYGDNGNMARMKNLTNITIEGVGEGAELKGWGLHFIAGGDRDVAKGEGTSFEVRNLTFNEYTEDAVGMEGQQSGSTITAPVSRCWIHHNTFLPGKCTNAAESDKKEGDGSCDFKRGEYFTASYNYFEYCHKTNLVGSSDDSLQYNMTYHHNMWYQCGSRIPLTRQANVHFYNNYVCGDMSETTTPYSHIDKPGLSYVHSLRANCYIFSEANYYEGSKNVTDGKSGGSAKGWNNVYYANAGTNTIEDVKTRDQAVSNKCKYGSIDYTKFDTNPEQFYYDAANKKSDCLLDDAVGARRRVLREVGVNGFTPRIGENMIKDADKPAEALSIPESGLTIDVTQANVGTTVNGVKFVNAKKSSGVAKGKGVLATFKIVEEAEISVSCNGSGETGCYIVKDDGTVIAAQLSSYNGILKPGTYMITSGLKDKESSLTALSFKCGTSDEEKVQNVINYINAIGEVALTQECGNKIDLAQTAYNALSDKLKANVTNYATLTAAADKYNSLAAAPVISLINAIGNVNEDSGTKITAARNAYNALNAAQKAKVTNYSTLTDAERTYESYEVQGVNKAIANLAAPSTASGEQALKALLSEYETVDSMYAALESDQKSQVTDYSKITSGIAAIKSALMPYTVRDMIASLPAKAEITLADSAEVKEARTAYDALTSEQKTAVGDITRLTDAEAAILTLASQTKVAIFTKNNTSLASNAGFTVNGTAGYKGTSQTFEYGGNTYNSPLKIQSGNSITFNTVTTMNVKIHLHIEGSEKIKLDGTSYTADSNGDIIIKNVAAGDHTIGRDGEAWLCYVELSPAE